MLRMNLIFLCLYLTSVTCQEERPVISRTSWPDQHIKQDEEKIEGVALESPARAQSKQTLIDINELGASHVCIMPYSFSDKADPGVQFDSPHQWWGERSDGVEVMIGQAMEAGLQVMLKPHLWIMNGAYTGHLSFEEASDQVQWSQGYAKYVLHYAELAERLNVPLFCIGTELCYLVQDDPEYWSLLIDSVKMVYSGQLTYAANWDCYADFPHWEKLDYIGIDAYFPIVGEYATDEPSKSWGIWKMEMKALSEEVDRPVLFTEYGYRAVDFAMEEPWEMSRDGVADEEVQYKALELLYQEMWTEPWFAGGFLWKWHYGDHLERKDPSRYTVQGKKAELLVKSQYDSE